MKVSGSAAPSNAFHIEQQPKNPGFVTVRFYENVVKDPTEENLWTYDEYKLTMEDVEGIEDIVLENYYGLLQQAKLEELSRTQVSPEAFGTVQKDVADLGDVVNTLLGVTNDE